MTLNELLLKAGYASERVTTSEIGIDALVKASQGYNLLASIMFVTAAGFEGVKYLRELYKK